MPVAAETHKLLELVLIKASDSHGKRVWSVGFIAPHSSMFYGHWRRRVDAMPAYRAAKKALDKRDIVLDIMPTLAPIVESWAWRQKEQDNG